MKNKHAAKKLEHKQDKKFKWFCEDCAKLFKYVPKDHMAVIGHTVTPAPVEPKHKKKEMG